MRCCCHNKKPVIFASHYMEESDVLYELLSRGIAPYSGENIASMNKKLRNLKYEAVLWFDKSCIVLKDLDASEGSGFFWRPHILSEAIKVIEGMVNDKLDVSKADSEVLNALEKEQWIEKSGDGYRLGKRFLVQNSEYLLSASERYRKCKFCDLIVKDTFSHAYCENLYKSEIVHQKEMF